MNWVDMVNFSENKQIDFITDVKKGIHPKMSVFLEPDKDSVWINQLEIKPKHRNDLLGKGYGSRTLKHITSKADEHNVELRLVPSNIGNKVTLDDKSLKDWYSRYGFKDKPGLMKDKIQGKHRLPNA